MFECKGVAIPDKTWIVRSNGEHFEYPAELCILRAEQYHCNMNYVRAVPGT